MNKNWGWAAILAMCALVYLLFPDFLHQTYAYLEHGDIENLAVYLQSFGIWSIVVIILLFIVMTFTFVFPFMILSGATGIIYGLFWGIIISWAGEVAGALVMFFLARNFCRHTAEKLISHSRYLKQVDDYSAASGFNALLIARLFPLAPSGIITAVAAISRISFRDFILATVIGKLPPVVIKVIMGYDIVFIKDHPFRLIAIIGVVVAIYGAAWLYRRKKKNIEPEAVVTKIETKCENVASSHNITK